MRVCVVLLTTFLAWGPDVQAAGPQGACATEPGAARDMLALHRYWTTAGDSAVSQSAAPADRDLDDVAVLEDRGDLVVRKHPFDLDAAAVRLSPNSAGGYDLARSSLYVEPGGESLGLGDDDARAVDLPFPFPFFGSRHTRVFVHSDGNVTFGAADPASSQRGLSRFLSGPPRIAPFFADLDPSRGGTVTTRTSSDRAVFVWSAVPGGGQINRNTFQAVLHPSGAIDFVYGAEVQTREGISGISPGGAQEVTAVDFSEARPAGSRGALAERFSETEKVDLVAVSRRLLGGRPDVFEQVVVYTTRPLNPVGGTLAFELNLRNEIEGIGLAISDDSAQWGSAGRLASLVYMDAIDPYLEQDGFEVLAHEVGHRWLARLRFRDRAGSASGALLDRPGVHWSFFLDTDASVLGGNDIDDRGGGRFETVDIARRYSPLDQYCMGLRAPAEVPPFFFVESPDDFRPNRGFKPSSGSEAGVSFTGIRQSLRIDDVVGAMGPRVPDASRSPRLLRQAFVLVADAVAPATEPRLRAVARIRSRFEAFYREATDGRGAVDSSLP